MGHGDFDRGATGDAGQGRFEVRREIERGMGEAQEEIPRGEVLYQAIQEVPIPCTLNTTSSSRLINNCNENQSLIMNICLRFVNLLYTVLFGAA